jgi:DDE superfamily endonuclease
VCGDPQRNSREEEGVAACPGIVQVRGRGTDVQYLRRNRVQAELAEAYGVSQPTISGAITGMTPLIGEVLRKYVPTADELDGRTQYIVDGTLLPCWSWSSHPELYSGKHKTTGMNVQVACTLAGDLEWISDPIEGSRRDTYCLGESKVLLTLDPITG